MPPAATMDQDISSSELGNRATSAGAALQLRQMPPDETALYAAEAELEALLEGLTPEDLADARAMLPKDLDTLFLCEPKGVPTERTYELTLVFKPSRVFSDLLAALRTWKHDLNVADGRST